MKWLPDKLRTPQNGNKRQCDKAFRSGYSKTSELVQNTLDEVSLHLNFDGHSPPDVWPSVSLCMIVKNEEPNLAACLESVGNFAREIIIVDTGSTDLTVEVAQSFGARVKHFTWIDDFAAARNESIKDAQGDWIFWMDADDRLSPENLIRLKQVVTSGRADAYICHVINRVQEANQSIEVIRHLRLFRNRLGLKFEQPIHEQVAPMALRLGASIAETNVTIEHIGYAADSLTLQKKARRNRAILEKCLAQEPNNLYWRFHLGVNLYSLDDWSGAVEEFEAVLANPPASLSVDDQLYEAYALLVAAHNNMDSSQKARQVLEQALKRFPNRQHLWVLAGKVYLAQNEAERAIHALENAKTMPDLSNQLGMHWPDGVLETLLGRAYLQLGHRCHKQEDYERMAESLSYAIELAPIPERIDACRFLAVALQKLGQEEESLYCWKMARHLEAELG